MIPGFAAILMITGYVSCTKETPLLAVTQTDFSSSSSVQIFNGTVRSARNFVYVDGVVVNGSALNYGGVFPGSAYSIKVNAGTRSILIKDTLPTTTQVPLTFNQNFDAGKSYTVFTYDTITSMKQTTVVNNITVPKDTTSMLRFANFIYNATPVANVDVFSFRRGVAGTGVPVFKNVATAQVTDFIPYSSGLTDTLYVYPTGAISPLLVKLVIPSFIPTRSYTTVYSGSYSGTKTLSTFATY